MRRRFLASSVTARRAMGALIPILFTVSAFAQDDEPAAPGRFTLKKPPPLTKAINQKAAPGNSAPPAPAPPPASTPATSASSASGKAAPQMTPSGKAQADTSNLSQFEQAMEYEPRNPNYKVSFSLEDADLTELVRVIGQLTGKRFIFGPKVKSIKASVYSPQKVTVAEAYQAFLSILEANGLTVVPQGRFLKIIETAGIQNQGTPIYAPGQTVPGEERYITRMHRLKHVSADEAAGVLGKFKTKDGDVQAFAAGNMIIMTDTGSNVRRMMTILEQIDVGSAGDQVWIEPVHYGTATDVAKSINELFDVKGGGSASSSAKGAPGGGAASGGASSAVAGDLHVAKILPDDRTNSLIIVATERAYLRMLELIKRLDVPQTGEGEIHVLPLQHADAVELSKTLNEIVGNAQAAGGRRPAAAAAGGAAPNDNIFEGAVRIGADKSTNSLVITSSLRDYASLRAVVDRLDQSRRQVFIDAVIMDLSINRSNSLGVSWHGGDKLGDSLLFGGLNAGKTIGPPSDLLQGAALGVRGPDIQGTQNLIPGIGLSIPAFGAIVSTLASTGDTDVLSTPHVLATDNVPAEISIGENVPRQTNIGLGGLGSLAGLAGGAGTQAGGAAGLAALGGLGGGFNPQFQDVGTKIKITPHINESNEVRMEVVEEISEAKETVGTAGVVSINKRTANTTLTVKDQQTVVIGGLMRNRVGNSTTKIPLLGDIPVLGALFRESKTTMQKTNLVLILTPYIIREQADLRNVFERKMQERQEFLDRYFVFGDSSYEPPKDYSRTNGLVEEIRQAYFQVEERKRLDEITRPKELKKHEPGTPLEMPANPRTQGGTSTSDTPPPTPAPQVTATPRLNVTPPSRNIERVER